MKVTVTDEFGQVESIEVEKLQYKRLKHAASAAGMSLQEFVTMKFRTNQFQHGDWANEE